LAAISGLSSIIKMRTLSTCKFYVVIEKAQADDITTLPGLK